MRSIPEGIRTHDNPSVSLRLPAPLYRGAFGASVGVDLRSTRRGGSESRPYKVRCVGVDALIDPCREAAKGRRADVGIRPYGCGGIKKHPCLSRDKGAHLCGTTLVAKRPLFGV